MASVGDYLRELRQRRGLSLEEMSRATRVASRYLECLESDRFSALPAPVFTRGFIRAYWCGSTECEGRIKDETRATIRVIPEDAEADGSGSCVYDGRPARGRALFAQSY